MLIHSNQNEELHQFNTLKERRLFLVESIRAGRRAIPLTEGSRHFVKIIKSVGDPIKRDPLELQPELYPVRPIAPKDSLQKHIDDRFTDWSK